MAKKTYNIQFIPDGCGGCVVPIIIICLGIWHKEIIQIIKSISHLI